MIESDFNSSERAETVRFSGSEFQTVVETLHDAAGNRLPGAKPVEQELSVGPQHACHLFHGLDPRAHDALAPKVKKLAGPEGGDIVPEELKVFLQQVAAHRFQVIAEEIAQFDFLRGCQILRPLEQAPAGMGEDGGQSLCLQFPSLLCPDLIDGLVHMHGDVKAVQNMDGLAGLLGDDLEVGFPHIAADEEQLSRPLLAEHPEKAQQGSDGPVLPHPQQALAFTIDLVDDGKVLVTSLPENLIDSDGQHVGQVPVFQAPLDHPFHGSEDLLPGRAEGDGGFFPRKSLGPGRKKLHVGFRHRAFAVRPRHLFDLHTAPRAVDPAQGIGEKDCDIPERHKLEHSRRQGVVTRPWIVAAGTNRLALSPGHDLDQHCQVFALIQPDDVSIHKRLELLDPIQNSFQLHPGFFSCIGLVWSQYQLQDLSQDALPHILPSRWFDCFSKHQTVKYPSRACGKCAKVPPLLSGTFASGGGNPRFLRIPTDAAFSIRPFTMSFYPQISLKTQMFQSRSDLAAGITGGLEIVSVIENPCGKVQSSSFIHFPSDPGAKRPMADPELDRFPARMRSGCVRRVHCGRR
jgi:hypothetical protein